MITGAAPLQLDTGEFLARYWQREHLFIRGALPGFEPQLTAEELAGLAMEEGVESRIVEYDSSAYHLLHGPFTIADYRRNGPWTLLVQGVDCHVPEVAALLADVDFIPRWRMDDVMVSYAVDGGSVGPHYDNYDVFLLQGEGKRQWQVGQLCDSSTPLQPHDGLRLLAEFEPVAEYLLEPGDILYLPPGVAHWGVARGESMTFSIGFRAPRINDMMSRWADFMLEQIDAEEFFRDPGRSPALRSGEIAQEDRQRAHAQLRAAIDRGSDCRWFGELVTEQGAFNPVHGDLATAIQAGAPGTQRVALYPGSRVAWQAETDGIRVFANGEQRLFPESVVAPLVSLCSGGELLWSATGPATYPGGTRALLAHLSDCGCIDVE